MPNTPVTIASVGTAAHIGGNGSQTRIVYAENDAAWWVFWIDSASLTSWQCARSADLSSWTAKTSATITTQSGFVDGREWAAGYANISSNDVVHTTHVTTNTYHLRGAISAGAVTWSSEDNVSLAAGANPNGGTICLDSTGVPWASSTSGGNLAVKQASNADSGTSWTGGWAAGGGSGTIFGTAAFAGSLALIPVASGHVLAVGDNGSSNKSWNNLEYMLWTSSWATGAAIRGSNLGSSQDPADWGWAARSNTDVHVVMKTGSNTFEHFRWNGTTFSAGDSMGNLATSGGNGVCLATDGTDVWAFTIASASGNDVYSNHWVSGTGWAGWTAYGLSSATRTNISCYSKVKAGSIALVWHEGSSSFMSLNFALTNALTRSVATTVTPVTTVAVHDSAQYRTVATTVTPSTLIAPTVLGRAVSTTVTPSTLVARSGGFARDGATTVTPSTLVTRLRSVPRAVHTTVMPATTVLARYQRARGIHTTVVPSFHVVRSGGFHRAVATTVVPNIHGAGVVIKLRSAHTTVTPATTVSVLRRPARGLITTVRQSYQAGALLTFGPTPAGALRAFLPVEIFDADQLIFSGWITQMVATSLSPDHQLVNVTAQDLYSLLTAVFPAEVFEQIPVGVMLQYLLAYNLPGATVGGVAPGPQGLYEAWENTGLDQIIKDLLATSVVQREPGVFHFDRSFNANLHFESDPFPPSPIELTDGNPFNAGSYPL